MLREYSKTTDFSLFIFGYQLKWRVWTIRLFCKTIFGEAEKKQINRNSPKLKKEERNIIKAIKAGFDLDGLADEAKQLRDDIKSFKVGDTIKVHYKIIEGRTERVQVFEGLCIAKKREGLRKTFTVRKISYGVGVERTFPLNSPRIQKIDVVRYGRVRRSKLYYIRDRVGKASKVAELIRKKES